MRCSTGLFAAVTLIAACFPCLRADAAVSYSYAAAPTSLTPPAGAVGFDVFLEEMLTAGSASIIAADGGLAAAAFKIEYVSGSGVVISDLAFNPAFDSALNEKAVSDTVASLAEVIDFSAPAVQLDGDSRVYLGTAWFTGDPGGSATFSIELYDNNLGNVATDAFRVLDADPGDGSFTPLAGGTQFTVNVPEPATAAAFVACFAIVGSRKRRT